MSSEHMDMPSMAVPVNHPVFPYQRNSARLFSILIRILP